MWLLTRYELLAPLSARHTPQLFRLLLPGEEVAALAKILPEQMMLRWLNHHIRAYLASNPGQTLVPQDFAVADLAANPKPSPTPNPIPEPTPNPEQVSDLADDLADCGALAICLHQVGPAASRIDLAAFALAEPHARAATLIADARRIGVECFEVSPSDLTTPRPRMALAFVAALMGTHPGLEAVDGFDLKEIMHRARTLALKP